MTIPDYFAPLFVSLSTLKAYATVMSADEYLDAD